MATREMITTLVGDKSYTNKGFNLSATVGTRGKNESGDVMVVQSLLKIIAKGSPILAGDAPLIKEVNGFFNLETDRAIRWFQHKFSGHLISQDGLVHPGSFKNRKIKFFGKQMTIYLLNSFARQSVILLYMEHDHTETLFKEFPQIKLRIKDG